MRHDSQTNALAETALALSMAFFSIMVLTLVSMGGGQMSAAVPAIENKEQLKLVPSGRKNPADERADPKSPGVNLSDIIFYFEGRYLDGRLVATSPTLLAGREKLILAVDPGLPVTKAADARAALNVPAVTITTIDQNWMTRLKELQR